MTTDNEEVVRAHQCRRARHILTTGAMAGLLLLSACGGQRTKRPYTEYVHVRPDARPEVMEAQMFEFAATFANRVEEAADRIRRESDDAEIGRRALMWKIHAIPAAQMACFRRDPLAAMLDMWILGVQMEDFFGNGAGAELFGPQQSIATAASESLLDEIEDAVGAFTKTPESVSIIKRDAVRPWVEVHPIQDLLFTRESPLALYVDMAREYGHDAFASLRTLEEVAIELAQQVRVYATQLPKHARWHAELVTQEALESEPVRDMVDHLASLEDIARTSSAAVEKIDGITADLERHRDAITTLISDERTALLDGVGEERKASIEALGHERELIMGRISEERDTVLQAIDLQRQATLEWLHAESGEISGIVRDELALMVEAIRTEREATMSEIEEMTTAAVAQSRVELEAVVDHAFWRLVQLLVVAVVAAPFIAWVYRFVLTRR
jgi:hypothetical protein